MIPMWLQALIWEQSAVRRRDDSVVFLNWQITEGLQAPLAPVTQNPRVVG